MKYETIIKVENLSKRYTLGHRPILSLRRSLSSLFRKRVKRKFWALDNISLEIQKGEIVGLIGKNGAGKSTFLKILSKITHPTQGRITLKGRVASLLEVGTGFHPELTGRENIYMNASILGMRHDEIKESFNEIVAFAGIESFLDTPVKKYSSGMYVRLAFSIAAHVKTDILLVDEVLAVGDAEFQRKSLGKMNEITKMGRTVIFVSHDLRAIQNLCTRCILFENGKSVASGTPEEIILKYESSEAISNINNAKGSQRAKITHHSIRNSEVNLGDDIILNFTIENLSKSKLTNVTFDLGINNFESKRVGWIRIDDKLTIDALSSIQLDLILKNWRYKKGNYTFTSYLKSDDEVLQWVENLFLIKSIGGNQIEPPTNQGDYMLEYYINQS